jgi:hypothetical protein
LKAYSENIAVAAMATGYGLPELGLLLSGSKVLLGDLTHVLAAELGLP